MVGRAEQRGWATDHARAGGQSSMGVVLDWLTTPGNYARWRAASSNKAALSAEVVRSLRQAGILHRKPGDVYKKIYDIEKSFQKAADQLRRARQQLRESKGVPADRSLHRALLRQSRYFVLLQPVMGECTAVDKQPKKRPLLSTRRNPPTPPARAAESPKKRKRKAPVAKRTTLPRACNQKRSGADCRGGMSEQKYRPSPKKRRARTEKEEEEEEDTDDEHTLPYPWNAEATAKTPVTTDEGSKVALNAEIEMERAQLDLAMRRLEVQAARDQALLARVKAREELRGHGIPLRDVNRLLPLDL